MNQDTYYTHLRIVDVKTADEARQLIKQQPKDLQASGFKMFNGEDGNE